MPYTDDEKRRECARESQRKRRAAAKAAHEGEQVLRRDGAAPAQSEAPEFVTMAHVEAAAQLDDEERVQAEKGLQDSLSRYKKKRYWACILYPDSLPDGWQDMLMQTGLSCAISPLHDSDVNADGSPKKNHFHALFCYAGPTSFNSVVVIARGMLHGTLPIPIESPRGYYRYFCHLDSPNKAQYDPKDITHFNGFNQSDLLDMTKSEVIECKKKLQRLIIENEIFEYSEFCDYVMLNESDDMYDVATSHTLFFNAYIRSKRAINDAYMRSVAEQ